MDKVNILKKYKKEEERLLVSKLFDKIEATEKQNKIHVTDFLSPIELNLLVEVLNAIKCKNYVIYGGIKNAQRNLIVIFPDKLESIFSENKFDYNSICNCIRITNNTEDNSHKMYLGGLIKLGVKREKIGDIIVFNNGADVIVSKEITKFLMNNLHELTRFKKSYFDVIDINQVTEKEQEYKDLKFIVSSLRLDNIVSELAKTSRNKAADILKQERVFINYKNETKGTKMVHCEDIISIRGFGKFIINEISGNTKNGKIIVLVKKFI